MLDNSKQDNLLNQYKLGVPPGIIITNLNITTNSNIFYNIKRDLGTLTPNGSFSMGMIQKVGTSFNHVGGFQ